MSATRSLVCVLILLFVCSCSSREVPPPQAVAPQAAGVGSAAKTAGTGDEVKAAEKDAAVPAAATEKENPAGKAGELTPEQLYSAMLALEDIGRVRARRLPHTFRTMQYLPDGSGVEDTSVRLGEITREIAGKVFYELRDEGQDAFAARIAVVAAVPLSDFKKETEFGRLVSEYLLTDLADRGLRVTELRLGRDINILPRTGEFIMSRNPGELASNVQDLDYVVVSTFSNTRRSLILQGRLVSLKNGLVESAWRYTMPLSRELVGLFSAGRKPYTISVRGMAQ